MAAFDKVIGQDRVKKFFANALTNERTSHAYLFVGDRGVGKEAMALEVAKALLCKNSFSCDDPQCRDCKRVARFNHPDLHFIFPAPAKVKDEERAQVIESLIENPYARRELWANPTISIEQIREVRRKAHFKSSEGQGRVVILVDCERMTVEAANSLLKILEEPPAKMRLLMTSSRPSLLLPTITSRCQEIKFDPLKAPEIEQALMQFDGVEKERAALVARLAAGSYQRASELLDEDLKEMQESALEFFRRSVQNSYGQMQYVDEILSRWQKDAKKIRDMLGLLAIWLRDAQVFKETAGDRNLLIHTDRNDVLQKFTTKFPNADLHSAVRAVEDSLRLMDRNVQVGLILIVLLSKLRRLVRS